jgi:hypothetical protein
VVFGGPVGVGGDVSCIAGIQFACSDGFQCIPSSWQCDTDPDCRDFSDESECGDITCPPDKYSCPDSSLCIPQSWLCDGTDDCPDGADEDFKIQGPPCQSFQASPVCPPNHIACPGSGSPTCIPATMFCNRRRDCPGGTDEGPMCLKVNSNRCPSQNCDDGCVETFYGPLCYCRDGFEVGDDKRTCQGKKTS